MNAAVILRTDLPESIARVVNCNLSIIKNPITRVLVNTHAVSGKVSVPGLNAPGQCFGYVDAVRNRT